MSNKILSLNTKQNILLSLTPQNINMKKIITTLLFFSIILSGYSQAYKGFKRPPQPNQEIGFSLGVANYVGDLSWNGKIPVFSETNPKAFRPAGALTYRNNFTNFTSFRTSFSLGGIYAHDAQSNSPGRVDRNLHFRSIIAELSLMLEWNMAPYRIGDMKKMFTPFVGVGIAGFYFNPQANLNGRWINLQPLGTEGQGFNGKKRYSRFEYAIPISFGFKANITKKLALNIEFQLRATFTDHLDDVGSNYYTSSKFFYDHYPAAVAAEADALAYRALSQKVGGRKTGRGENKFNDHYYFTMIGISYKIGGNKRNTCNSFR